MSVHIDPLTGLELMLPDGVEDVLTSPGDMVIGGESGNPIRFPIGTPGQQPQVNAAGTGLEYVTPSAGGATGAQAIAYAIIFG